MTSIRTVQYRRKREGKTDYNARLRLLRGNLPRFIIRRTLHNIIAQVATYEPSGDKIHSTVTSGELAKYGWKGPGSNTPAAYLVGLLAGKKAVAKGVNVAISDIGMQSSVKSSVLYAVIKGANDAGLSVSVSDAVVPSAGRLRGEHVAAWAVVLKQKDSEMYKRVFSEYLKNSLAPEELPVHTDVVKKKIGGKA